MGLAFGLVVGIVFLTGCQPLYAPSATPTQDVEEKEIVAGVPTIVPTPTARELTLPTAAPTRETVLVRPPATPMEAGTPSVEVATSVAAPIPSPSPTVETPMGLGEDSYLLLNQTLTEGLYYEALDLEEVDDVFWHIFSRLPNEVMVYPSENYFYFILNVQGRQIWGNMRLPAGRRERGVLSFAYFEFIEFTSVPSRSLSRAKYYTKGDGLTIEEIDSLTWNVVYGEKEVVFNLHPLIQEPPNLFPLGEDEVFVQRTFDESGFQFFLIFNTARNYFLWVLNEEEFIPDTLEDLGDNILSGKRSGFAFWVDEAHGNRKVLAAIRRISVTRNDYFDGPFDQLADNDVDVTDVKKYMIMANPGLEDRIDKYGYYTDTERPLRVAISAYGTYYTTADLRAFMGRAIKADDPYQYISRSGVPLPVSETTEGGPDTAP